MQPAPLAPEDVDEDSSQKARSHCGARRVRGRGSRGGRASGSMTASAGAGRRAGRRTCLCACGARGLRERGSGGGLAIVLVGSGGSLAIVLVCVLAELVVFNPDHDPTPPSLRLCVRVTVHMKKGDRVTMHGGRLHFDGPWDKSRAHVAGARCADAP